MKIAMIGSGGWGTAISVLLSENGHDTTLWSFLAEEAAMLKTEREHKTLLPGVILPDDICVTNDLQEALSGAQAVVIATPSFAVAATLASMKPYVAENQIIVCLTKGIDKENGYSIFADTIEKELGRKNPVVALTGPSHAEEVGRKMPTAVVAASRNLEACETVQDAFMCDTFRVYTTPDIIGAQLAGALKNVIALAAGICDGMGYGDNTKAALMTRGLTEMARLGVAMGSRKETFAGLAGIGDLIVTCTSMHSRNRRAGILIGQGHPPQDAMKAVGSVVEGYYAVEAGYMLSQRHDVEMPICSGMYNVLYENGDLKEKFYELMTRAKRHESEAYWINS